MPSAPVCACAWAPAAKHIAAPLGSLTHCHPLLCSPCRALHSLSNFLSCSKREQFASINISIYPSWPPQTLLYSFFGSSRQLGVGPVAITSLLIGQGAWAHTAQKGLWWRGAHGAGSRAGAARGARCAPPPKALSAGVAAAASKPTRLAGGCVVPPCRHVPAGARGGAHQQRQRAAS